MLLLWDVTYMALSSSSMLWYVYTGILSGNGERCVEFEAEVTAEHRLVYTVRLRHDWNATEQAQIQSEWNLRHPYTLSPACTHTLLSICSMWQAGPMPKTVSTEKVRKESRELRWKQNFYLSEHIRFAYLSIHSLRYPLSFVASAWAEGQSAPSNSRSLI